MQNLFLDIEQFSAIYNSVKVDSPICLNVVSARAEMNCLEKEMSSSWPSSSQICPVVKWTAALRR